MSIQLRVRLAVYHNIVLWCLNCHRICHFINPEHDQLSHYHTIMKHYRENHHHYFFNTKFLSLKALEGISYYLNLLYFNRFETEKYPYLVSYWIPEYSPYTFFDHCEKIFYAIQLSYSSGTVSWGCSRVNIASEDTLRKTAKKQFILRNFRELLTALHRNLISFVNYNGYKYFFFPLTRFFMSHVL